MQNLGSRSATYECVADEALQEMNCLHVRLFLLSVDLLANEVMRRPGEKRFRLNESGFQFADSLVNNS